MSLEEKGVLGDSGDGTSYHVFREAEFSTRTGRKIRKIETSYLSSRWGEKSGTRNDGSVTGREGRGRRVRRLVRDGQLTGEHRDKVLHVECSHCYNLLFFSSPQTVI